MSPTPDGPPELHRAIKAARAEADRYRRMLVFQQLETIDVDVTTPAGLNAIDEYPLRVDGEIDMSLRRLRLWLAEHAGTEVY